MKKYLFLLITICISQLMALNASAGKPQSNPDLSASGKSTATDNNGNVYVTGGFLSPTIAFTGTTSTTATLTNEGSWDMYIVKYDSSGAVLWAKSIGGSGIESGGYITTDRNGNIYVAGIFRSPSITIPTLTGTTTLSYAGGTLNDIFIIKYDASGNVLWAQGAGGTLNDEPSGLATDTSGNVFMTGNFASDSITFGETTLYNKVNRPGLFVVKYDLNGNILWAEKFIGTGSQNLTCLTTDRGGNIYLSGFFTAITFGPYQLTSVGGWDMFIVKCDPGGNVLWAKSAGGAYMDFPWEIATDGNGNVYVTGLFTSSILNFGSNVTLINPNGGSKGSGNMFIVKYNAGTGTALWARNPAGIANEGYSVAADGSGNVFATGAFSGSSISFGNNTPLINASSGYVDLFIVKYNSSGTALWSKRAGGTQNDQGFCVATDGKGNALLTGTFESSSIIFGRITLSNTNGKGGSNYGDMFIAKYASDGTVPWAKCAGNSPVALKTVNAGINDPTANEITIYPNPTSGMVVLSNTNSQSVITNISVFNMTGKEVLNPQLAAGSSVAVVDFSLQPKGLYLLLIKVGNNYYRRKIIVE